MSTSLATVTGDNVPRIAIALGLLGVAVVVLALGLWYYRRHWVSTPGTVGIGWTLDDIRAMRDRGEVTEGEYQALRANLLGVAQTGPSQPSRAGLSAGTLASGPPGTENGADPSGDTVWSFDLKKSPPG